MRRLAAPDHREALALAGRPAHGDTPSTADDRRALPLYWHGFGAARQRTEQDVLLEAWERHGRSDQPRIAVPSHELADVHRAPHRHV